MKMYFKKIRAVSGGDYWLGLLMINIIGLG